MRYRIHKSIDIDFAHHVTAHPGACINVHGHTWKFEVYLSCYELNPMGFVVDFGELKGRVLKPVHTLLDHSFAIWDHTFEAARHHINGLGQIMVSTRDLVGKDHLQAIQGEGYDYLAQGLTLCGARNAICGGIKVAVFPFPPTSERLAEWLYNVAALGFSGGQHDYLIVDQAKVYETLHPVEAVATYGRIVVG